VSRWNFLSLDAFGFSGGMVIGCEPSMETISSCVIVSGLCMVLHCREIGKKFQLINVYGSYENREDF
jgi:hypothetical protein